MRTERSNILRKPRRDGIARIIQAVPALMRLPEKNMRVVFDRNADVLYLAFQRPQKATDSEMRDDGIIVHRRSREVVGVTILDVSQR